MSDLKHRTAKMRISDQIAVGIALVLTMGITGFCAYMAVTILLGQ